MYLPKTIALSGDRSRQLAVPPTEVLVECTIYSVFGGGNSIMWVDKKYAGHPLGVSPIWVLLKRCEVNMAVLL